MAKKKGPKGPKKAKAVARAKTGAARRKTQKRVGKPGPPTNPIPNTSSAEAAKTWLIDTARKQLSLGRTLRTSGKANADAFPDVHAMCVAYAMQLKTRGILSNLVAGAALIARDEEAAAAESALPSLPSLQVQKTAARVQTLRGALNRILTGPRNSEARKAFGMNVPMNPNQPSSVLKAANGLIAGAAVAATNEAAGFILAEDVKELKADVKAIEAEQKKAKKERTEGTSETTERDIRTAALELFYDKYAAAVSVVIADPVERLKALQVVPRREERRGAGEEGGGTGSARTS